MNNYVKQFNEEISKLSGRPNLLLHVCCGPCSVYPLYFLNRYFKITVYYANANIYPYEEYQKRLSELLRYLKMIDRDIEIIIAPYHRDYQKQLAEYAFEKEGKHRCVKCYALRMKEAYDYADEHGYDYFTTIMSISDHKNADYINHIGQLLEKSGQTRFLYADFKKQGGIDKNRLMNQKLDLYHQNYCGCLFSKTLAKKQ